MKMSCLLSATRHLALAGMLVTLSLSAQGAALFTLKGTAADARLGSEAEVRLSLLGWTEPDQAQAIVDEYQRYAEVQDHATFGKFLQEQQTRGYLFTKAATGYSIKYAWQEESSDVKRMVLLVTPALKTRNPYLWNEANDSPAPFSLVELRFDGEEASLKYASDDGIAVTAGHLELEDYAATDTFATLRDDTPYYLKDSS